MAAFGRDNGNSDEVGLMFQLFLQVTKAVS